MINVRLEDAWEAQEEAERRGDMVELLGQVRREALALAELAAVYAEAVHRVGGN